MKVLITGSTGFIGTALVKHLLADGYDVVEVSRRPSEFSETKKIVIDDLSLVTYQDLPKVDSIIHLAGIAHTRKKGNAREIYNKYNNLLAVKLAELSVEMQCEKFIFLSSAKVHGSATMHSIDSSSPFSPEDFYAESKVNAENALSQMVSKTAMIALRPPVVYGENSKANIATLANRVKHNKLIPLPTKSSIRSFVSSSNLCNAIENCLRSKINGYNGFLVHDGSPIATEDFIISIANAQNLKPHLLKVPTGVFLAIDKCLQFATGSEYLAPLYKDFIIDCNQLYRETQWEPIESTEQGIQRIFGNQK